MQNREIGPSGHQKDNYAFSDEPMTRSPDDPTFSAPPR